MSFVSYVNKLQGASNYKVDSEGYICEITESSHDLYLEITEQINGFRPNLFKKYTSVQLCYNPDKAKCSMSLVELFYNCENLRVVNLDNFHVQCTNATRMLANCKNLNMMFVSMLGIDFQSVYSVEEMFMGVYSYHPNCLNFNTLNYINADRMFAGVSFENTDTLSLTSIGLDKIYSAVGMFQDCKFFNNFELYGKTDGLKDISCMFKNAESLFSLKLCIDTSKIFKANEMFKYCEQLRSFTSTGKLSHVAYADEMFYGSGIKSVNLGLLGMYSLKYYNYMFKDCFKLEYLNLVPLNINLSVEIGCGLLENCVNLLKVFYKGNSASLDNNKYINIKDYELFICSCFCGQYGVYDLTDDTVEYYNLRDLSICVRDYKIPIYGIILKDNQVLVKVFDF